MLTVTLAVGCFALVATVVGLTVHPSGFPPTRQDAETALYAASFLLIVPAALVAGPRLADRLGGDASPIAALLAAGFAAAVILARVAGGGGVHAALVAFAAWSLVAALLLARPPAVAERLEPFLWAAAGALTLGAVLCFGRLGSISIGALLLGVPVAAGLLAAYARFGGRFRLRRRAAVAADVGAVALLLLAVPDVVIFGPQRAGESFFTNQTAIAQFHQNFVLGPANVVLHGGAMLVDTASQYGVGSIYFLFGWFKLAPIGYGTFGFLDAALFALLYAAAYGVLRLSGAPRSLAAATLAVAVVVLIYNLLYPVGSLPAQHGPQRFGMPMLVVLAATLGERWPPGRAAELVVVGLSSIWSLEVFAYTAATFAAIVVFRGSIVRRLALAFGACVVAHLVLLTGTLIGSGDLPDYGWYGDYVGGFLFGGVGEITFDFGRWSPGLAVGVAYAASTIAFLLVVRRRPDLLETERPALVALCGTTAYGVVLFSYYVNRSADHILPYVSLPALLAAGLWLSLLLRLGSPRVRLGGLAFALALALVLTAIAWSSIGDRFPDTALGRALPGGNSLGSALNRLWHLPPIDPRTAEAETLVERDLPGEGRALVVLPPDLETETLIRSDRTNALPIAFAPEDGFISGRTVPRLRRAIAHLRPGDRLLTDTTAFDLLPRLRRADPLRRPVRSPAYAPIQEWVLRELDRRFRLQVLHRGRQGLLVVRLSA